MPATMADVIKGRMARAANQLGVASPNGYVGGLLDRSFPLPPGSPEYGTNALVPGAAACVPSFSEPESDELNFTIEPLGPGVSPVSRRNEATREVRRLIGPLFGNDALRWFDEQSEEWRTTGAPAHLCYGAWFGSSYDSDGLRAAKVYYETPPNDLHGFAPGIGGLVRMAMNTLPYLIPVFTSIECGRESGSQQASFLHAGPLRLADLKPLLEQLGMSHQLAGILQIAGLSLGGRFELPERSVLLGLRNTVEGPELRLDVMLGAIPDLPAGFLDLVSLGLAERPRQLHALHRWLQAMTPDSLQWPGQFSTLSIRVTPRQSARVGLHLRPVEFEVTDRMRQAGRAMSVAGSRN